MCKQGVRLGTCPLGLPLTVAGGGQLTPSQVHLWLVLVKPSVRGQSRMCVAGKLQTYAGRLQWWCEGRIKASA